MRVILLPCGPAASPPSLAARTGADGPPLLDRTLLQHVVESLASRCARTIEVVAGADAALARAVLGDGTRWGVAVRHHAVPPGCSPYTLVAALAAEAGDGWSLIVHADRLASDFGDAPTDADAGPVLFCAAGGPPRDAWTGWAWARAPHLAPLRDGDGDGGDEARLAECLFAPELDGRVEAVPTVLRMRTVAEYLEAHRQALAVDRPRLLFGCREVDTRVWVARGVRLHETAQLTHPVYLGKGCRVEAGAFIGPHAVIGAGAVIDAGTSVVNSVVLPATYVGRGLTVCDAVVDRALLVNVRLGAEVLLGDPCLLGDLSLSGAPSWPKWRPAPRLRAAVARAVAVLRPGWSRLAALPPR